MIPFRTLFLVAVLSGTASFTSLQARPQTDVDPVREPGRLFLDLHEMLAEPAAEVGEIALGDVDGDGDLDAFQGCSESYPDGYLSEPNGLWINDGTGRFLLVNELLPDFADITKTALLVDLNGDDAPDLLLGSDEPWGVGEDRLLLNNGHGRFEVSEGALPTAGSTNVFVAADVDGDLDLDLVCGRDDQDLLYINDGSGVFTDMTLWLPADPRATYDLAFCDVEGNGSIDLLVARLSEIQLYVSDGMGHFMEVPGAVPAGSQSISIGDIDNDMDPDLLGGGRVLLNDGFGVYTDMGFASYGELIDVTGGGYVDILSPTALFLNDTTGNFTDASGQIPDFDGSPRGWAIGDLDGDGDQDYLVEMVEIMWPFYPEMHAHLVLNDGTGVFEDGTAWSAELPRRDAYCGAMADMDGDGDLDIVTGARLDAPWGSWEHKFFLFLNDGFGRFTDRTDLLPYEWTLVYSVALGDVDGDLDNDIVLGGWDNWDGEGGGCRLFLNQGTSGFTDDTNQLPPNSSCATNDVELGDVDGDEDLDILQLNDWWPPFGDQIMINDGSGNFTLSTTFPTVAEYTGEGALVDVDGDKDLDVLSSGEDLRLFLNDGLGAFTDASSNIPAGEGTSLGTADLEDDGDVDLLIGRNGVDQLYVNDGSGVFTPAGGGFAPGSWETDDTELVDMDGNGAPDILAVGREDDYGSPYGAKLYMNDGGGAFRSAPHRLPRGLVGSRMAFGDVDEDGDPDMLMCDPGWGYGRLYSNLRRHVAWRSLPRIGWTMDMDLNGAPDDFWLLASALGTTRIPLGIGVLFLDPSTLVVVGSGVLDNAGKGTMPIPVPNDLGLVGTSVYWQAVIGSPMRLTNLETSTFTAL